MYKQIFQTKVKDKNILREQLQALQKACLKKHLRHGNDNVGQLWSLESPPWWLIFKQEEY